MQSPDLHSSKQKATRETVKICKFQTEWGREETYEIFISGALGLLFSL